MDWVGVTDHEPGRRINIANNAANGSASHAKICWATAPKTIHPPTSPAFGRALRRRADPWWPQACLVKPQQRGRQSLVTRGRYRRGEPDAGVHPDLQST